MLDTHASYLLDVCPTLAREGRCGECYTRHVLLQMSLHVTARAYQDTGRCFMSTTSSADNDVTSTSVVVLVGFIRRRCQALQALLLLLFQLTSTSGTMGEY